MTEEPAPAASPPLVGEWVRACGLQRADALALLRACAGISHAALLAHPEAPLPDSCAARLRQAAQRVRAGEPLAYVLGWKEFYGLRLQVGPQVLVPRPETELLVEFALQHLRPRQPAEVLDLGTGSGAVAIAVAAQRAHARVHASDRSAEALRLAQDNAARLLPAARPGGPLQWHLGDWMQALPEQAGPFDLLLSNPPYVAADDPHLAALRFEPALALVGARRSADGLAEIRALLVQAVPRLRAGGWLALEHGWNQAAAVRALLRDAGLRQVHSLRDLAGIPRVGAARAAP